MNRLLSNFDGRRFHNPAGPVLRGFFRQLKWGLTRRRKPWPKWRENRHPFRLPDRIEEGAVAVTFINHSSFLIQTASLNLLIDPVYSRRASPVSWAGPARVRDPGVPFEQLPPIHVVLVSHNHYDHCDLPTLRRLRDRFGPAIVTGRGNAAWFAGEGFSRVTELDWWQAHELSPDLRVTFTPAQHFSMRNLRQRDNTLWGGFHFSAGAQRLYFLGDSGYCDHFKEIRAHLGAPDLALIPIGSYEPRWFMRGMHVNPAEAVQVFLDLQARQALAMHFGTFRLADEGIDEPVEALHAALAERGVARDKFVVPEFGQTFVVRERSVRAL